MRRARELIPAIAVLAALAAAPSAGATRYAAPGGTGPGATCPQDDPCSITVAVTTGTPDTVIALPGTYSLGVTTVFPSAGVTLIGAPGQPRPRLVSAGVTALSLGAGRVARNLYIESAGTGSSRVVDVVGAGALLDQSEIVGAGAHSVTLQVRDQGTVRNSVVRSNSTSGFASAIVAGGTGGHIESVTAIAAGTPPSMGISVPAAFVTTPPGATVFIRNSIVDGNGGPAIAASDDGGADSISVLPTRSNFPEFSEQPPDARVFAEGQNQTGAAWLAPLLASPVTADFHQLAGSPTIDAGTDIYANGLDIDGQRRSMGIQTDMGADEFPGACAGQTATVSGTVESETLVGTPGADVFAASAGDDTIRGLGGNDLACGGDGQDKILGGGGNDRLFGEFGRDTLKGGPGKDRLVGGASRDKLVGGKGKDRLKGGPGRDLQTQ